MNPHGAGLVLGSGVLWICVVALSLRFASDVPADARPIPGLVACLGGLWALYALALWRLVRRRDLSLAWVLIGALAFRAILFASRPALEDDYQRYVWDGAVLAAGLTPYGITPASVQDGTAPKPYLQVAASSPRVEEALSGLNHPELPTVYPPLAQALFGLAAWLAPGSRSGLRVVWLGLDLATCAALVLILRRLGRDPAWVLAYAWSPLLLHASFVDLHLDVAAAFLVAASTAVFLVGRTGMAGLLLGLAVSARLLPALFVPVQLGLVLAAGRRASTMWAAGLAAGALPLIWWLAGPEGSYQGLAAYLTRWANNGLLFPAGKFILGPVAARAVFWCWKRWK